MITPRDPPCRPLHFISWLPSSDPGPVSSLPTRPSPPPSATRSSSRPRTRPASRSTVPLAAARRFSGSRRNRRHVTDLAREGRWLQLRLADAAHRLDCRPLCGAHDRRLAPRGPRRPSARSGPRPRAASRSWRAAAAWRLPIPPCCASAPGISAGFPAAAPRIAPARTRPPISPGWPAPSPG